MNRRAFKDCQHFIMDVGSRQGPSSDINIRVIIWRWQCCLVGSRSGSRSVLDWSKHGSDFEKKMDNCIDQVDVQRPADKYVDIFIGRVYTKTDLV